MEAPINCLDAKGLTDPETECPTYPVSYTNAKCVKNTASEPETPCAQRYMCSTVTQADKTSDTTIKCEESIISDENEGSYKCIDSVDAEKGTICKEEKYLCSEVPSTSKAECSSFDVETANKVCKPSSVVGGKKCVESEMKCNDVPIPADSSSVVCSNYPIEGENTLCVQDQDSQTKACKEMTLCEHVATIEKDEDCLKYPVQTTSTNMGCFKKGTESTGIVCTEKTLCKEVSTVTNDIECYEYPVSAANINTHNCVKASGEGKPCTEAILCENVKAPLDDGDKCSNHPVKKSNYGTYTCITNTGTNKADQPCKEEKKCNEATEGTSDDECSNYVVAENGDDYKCVKKLSPSTTGCEERQLCDKVLKGEVTCGNYPVKDKTTHKCVARVAGDEGIDTYACKEKELTCTEGTDADKCGDYPIEGNDGTKKCIKNTDKTPETICKVEALSACELKSSGVTKDDECSKLAVEEEGKQICQRNGDKCELVYYCNYAVPKADTGCNNYPKEDNDKVCQKKSGENLCEEVEKSSATTTCGQETDPEKCSTYIQEDVTKKCSPISDANAGEITCEVKTKNCNEVTTGAVEGTCGNLPVSDDSKYKCQLDGTACKEVEIEDETRTCSTETDKTKCGTYTPTDITKKCVENTDETPATVCKEEAKSCSEIGEGANNEICGKINLEDEFKICRLKSDESGCEEVAYCGHGDEKGEDECGKYYVKDSNKKYCKYNEDEDKCEEATKPSTGSGNLIRTSMVLLLLITILI